MSIRIKRIYEAAASQDGYRVLVDGIWPRGVSKERAALDEWCRDLAPSKALRQWFGHDPARWQAFRQRYFEELDAAAPEALDRLRQRARQGRVTLVFAARDPAHNNAVALRDYLERP